jgi:hypothetical protein
MVSTTIEIGIFITQIIIIIILTPTVIIKMIILMA